MSSHTHTAPPSFMTVPEVAAELGVAVPTVYTWIRRRVCGILPAYTPDGHVYLHRGALEQLRRPAGVALPTEKYRGQVKLAREAGLSTATIESVRQGCYSDADLDRIATAGARPEPS